MKHHELDSYGQAFSLLSKAATLCTQKESAPWDAFMAQAYASQAEAILKQTPSQTSFCVGPICVNPSDKP